MSSSDQTPAYLGLGSVLAVSVCTLWLAAVGHLDLYINPRYDLFTVLLAVVAVPASVAGLVVVARGHGHSHGDDEDGHAHEHAHQHGDGASTRRATRTALGAAAALVTVGITVAMLVLPPTTLSARTAQQRSVDSPTLSNASGTQDVALLGSAGVDTSQYGVKDWAALIRQTTDTSALVGKPVELTGFVVPGSGDAFTLTRFVISCCAVDAQPVGLGVVTGSGGADGGGSGSGSDTAVPDSGQWVRVTGKLAANPDPSADARIVVRAAKVQDIEQPADPYEY